DDLGAVLLQVRPSDGRDDNARGGARGRRLGRPRGRRFAHRHDNSPLPMPTVTVVGAGLAGCEASWQLAERGIDVRLIEQKALPRTAAQRTDALCELVCSNSMRGAALANAVGLLKEELRRVGSLVLTCADATQVPAGGALAVDRDAFSRAVTERLRAHPRVVIQERVVDAVPEASPCAPV